jgi:hypothetical protein
VISAADEACQQILAAGAHSASVVEVDDGHAILVLAFPDVETEERVSAEIGGPWMRKHVLELLSGPPERSSGVLVAGSLWRQDPIAPEN